MIFEKVQHLCKERGVSIWALESSIGVGNGTIGKWRSSSPRMETIKKVADYFGVTVDELINDKKGDGDVKTGE